MNKNKEKKNSNVIEEYETQQEDEKQEPIERQTEEKHEPEEDGCPDKESCSCDESKSETSKEEVNNECQCEKETDENNILKEKLIQAETKQDEYLKMAQRVQADFENYKRRNKNTVADTYQAATAEVVEAFLPVLDNLDRAIDSTAKTDADKSILDGIELVRRQFMDALSKLDVEEIDALGKPFDPEYHNAVGQIEAEEGQEKNTVVIVHQKGYKIGKRVIRYSMVHVAC